MADLQLYAYQEEVAERALQGENVIIWLPTGGGKTRVAVYVAKKHLETNPKAKVVMLVNMVHLVDQHYTKEFKPHLGSTFVVEPITGVSEKKDFLGNVLQDSGVIICTAELLYNALTSKEEAKHVDLSEITLLIVDECHNTKKEAVYNKIMQQYLKKKSQGERNLPQILGLTASPGTGNANSLEKAVNYVLQICANLDSAIVSTKTCALELKERVPRPRKTYDIVEKRLEDPFGDHLKWLMQQIHEYMNLPSDFKLREYGTQEYEMDVVALQKHGIKEHNRLLQQCAIHLREYNDALLINDTLRMMDAYNSLEDFYRTKFVSAIDGTDYFLVGLFQENQVELRKLAMDLRYENPKMAKLEEVLLKQFGPGMNSRGILFCKTRKSTRCLSDWVLNSRALQEAGVKAAILTGAGNSNSHMTQHEQGETIRHFGQGSLNLLISTSVAEEGLDIPECNLVVRYGLLTNEIAQLQASGRARAKDSRYSLVAQERGREERRERINECLEELNRKAIAKVQEMSTSEFRQKIAELQEKAIIDCKNAEKRKQERRRSTAASSIKLLCRNCLTAVASGSDIKRIESTYVNISPDFKKHYTLGELVVLERSFDDWVPGHRIRCAGKCNQEWGYEMKFKGSVLLPNVAIKHFVLETPGGRLLVKQWKDVPFTVEEFNLEEYCQENMPDLFD
ncbi:ATP-dependent RNA helicase DHX58 [Aulostomus maculatus]